MSFSLTNRGLHSRSPHIFGVCLACALVITGLLLTLPLPEPDTETRTTVPAPVIIQLQNIPETRQVYRTPAPAKPFIPDALPIATDDLVPDTVTIEDTSLDLSETPAAPPAILTPAPGVNDAPSAAEEENEIFEYYNVEEPPRRSVTVQPEYPDMARRAGIQGTVTLKVLVNAEGKVESVEVQSGPTVFHKSAIAAAKATHFEPARQNDRAVPCWVVMPFRFVAQGKR